MGSVRHLEEDEQESVKIVYTIYAKPEQIFAAWITPKLIQRWGPEKAEVDARLGGRFSFESKADEKGIEKHNITGEYKRFEPGKLLQCSWIYQGPMSEDVPVATELTVELLATEDGGVELHLSEVGPSLADAEAREATRESWLEALKMLEIICSSKLY